MKQYDEVCAYRKRRQILADETNNLNTLLRQITNKQELYAKEKNDRQMVLEKKRAKYFEDITLAKNGIIGQKLKKPLLLKLWQVRDNIII